MLASEFKRTKIVATIGPASFPPSILEPLIRRLAPLAPLVAPWTACLPLLADVILERVREAAGAPSIARQPIS